MNGQTIRTITIRGTSEGIDKVTSDLKTLAAAEKDVAVVSDDLSKKQLSLASSLKAQTLRLDDGARAANKYAAEMRLSQRGVEAGLRSQETHNQMMALAANRYGQLGNAAASSAKPLNDMMAAMSANAVASGRMVTSMTNAGKAAQEAIIAATKPLHEMAASMSASAVASGRMVASMTTAGKAAQEAAEKPAPAISRMIAGMTAAGDVGAVASHRMVTGMSAVGKASAGAAEEVAKVSNQNANLAKQSALATKETSRQAATMLNLGRQFADVGVSLQMGQSLLTVGVQQVPQIIDAVVSSGKSARAVFADAAVWAGRFAMSTGGVVTGLAAVAGAAAYSAIQWNEAKVDVQRSLMGIGQQSGVTAGQVEDIAEKAASTTRITVSGAREMASALAQTGKIGVEEMTKLVNIGHNFAKVLGVDITEASKIMAQSFADPGKGVEALATKFSIIPKQMAEVQKLAAQGNFAGAQAALRDVITPQLKDAASASSAISHAWETTKKLVDEVGSALNRNIDAIFDMGSLTQRLNVAQTNLAEIKSSAISPMAPSAVTGGRVDPAQAQRISDATKRVEELQAALNKMGQDKSFAVQAQGAVELSQKIAPDIAQIENMRNALIQMDRALQEPKALKLMSPQQIETLQQARNLTKDQLNYVDRIRATYSGVRTEIAKQLDILTSQAQVAGARSQAEQLSAQFAVDYKTAMAQGATAAEAVQVANKQRAVTVASIAKQERNMVQASQDQLAIAQETTNAGRAKAEAEATYNQLLAQNVSAGTAATVAANQHAAATTQIAKQEKDVVQASTDQLGISREVTLQGKARAASQATYNQLIAQGVSEETAATVAANQHKAAQIEINRQAENIVGSLSDQADVASAIGGRAKVNAQAQATYNDMVRQGYDASMALAASEETRRAGLGAINAAMAEQLASLQDQGMVAGASTGAQKIAAQSQAAYNKAIRDGASETQAAAIAQQVYANGVAAANAAVENQIYEVNKAADIARVAGTSMEAATKAAWAYSDALRSGADEAHAFALEQAVLNAETAKFNKQSAQTRAQEAGGKYLQFVTDFGRMIAAAKEAYGEGNYESTFSMQGYETVTPTLDWMGTKLFGEDNYKINKQTKTVLPSDEYLGNALFGEGNYKTDKGMISPTGELLANALLQREGSLSGAVNTMIQKMDLRDTDYTGTIERVIGLLPKEQQIDPLKAEIEKVKQLPVTLAREELLKSLNDSLKSLEESVDANTEAKMDPLFSQGHEFINQLKIGYYKAAEGGIFGPGGPMRLMPVNRYASGGIASSPQMAMFGEAGPEAFIPLKGGAVPVTIKTGGASNDNSKNITQNITQNITINTTPADRLTGRQRAQGFITAATNAAAAA